MKKQTVSQIDNDEQIISSQLYNDPRVKAFDGHRQPHKPDNIGWVVGSVLMFIFLVLSVGRLTIVGELFDDVLFSFLFGWMKYLVYLTLFTINFALLFGYRVKIKFRMVLRILLFWTSLAWIFSTSIMFANKTPLWSKDLFVNTMTKYVDNWLTNSIFGVNFQEAPTIKFAFWNFVPAFVNLNQAGGIIGGFVAASFGYLSLPVSLILATVTFFLSAVWILTGTPIYLFLPKKKRKGKSLRLLPLKKHDNPYLDVNRAPREWEMVNSQTSSAKVVPNSTLEELNQKEQVWKEITVMNETSDQKNKTQQVDEDNTFEFKTYDDELNNNFYEERPKDDKAKLQSYEEFLAIQKAAFENLNPNEVRKKFARDFSDIRPYGDLKDEKTDSTVKNFVPFKEASLDDTDFLNDLALETNLSNPLTEPKTTDLIIVHEDQVEPSFNQTYLLPDLDLLDDIKQERRLLHENQADALEKQQAIDKTFNQFKVGAKVVDIVYGPAVIKFEIQPQPGTKVNSISALENDLKLALASQNMRLEAPIPGKNLVGIEVEAKHRLVVGLKEMLKELEKKSSPNKLLFALGKDVENRVVFADLAKMPHLLVAGSTGSGKSVMINSLIVSLLMRTTPQEVQLLLIDPKKVELAIYSPLPHMLMPVISDVKEANKALKTIVAEMERRYELFAKNGVKNIESFNKKQSTDQRLPYYVIIIDELADLMMTSDRKEVEDSIMRITQLARAAGIHLIVATQRPSVDVITGVIKANIPSRIAFSVATSTDSRTILDSGGAEKLTGKGDMLYLGVGTSNLVRVQGAYLSDEEIERVIEFIMRQEFMSSQTDFINEFLEQN